MNTRISSHSVGVLVKALAVIAVGALTVGCAESKSSDDRGVASLGGDGSADPSDGEKKSFQDAALEFARCMRRNGVEEFPDPTGNGFAITPDTDIDPEDMEEADKKCGHLMEGVEPPELSEEERDAARDEILAFARCMRDLGWDIPDPTFDDNGNIAIEIGDPDSEMSPDNPEFERDNRHCDEVAREGHS